MKLPYVISAPDPGPKGPAPVQGPPSQPQQPPPGKDGNIPWPPSKSDPLPFKL